MTADRLERVRHAMDTEGIKAMVVTDPANLRWLTGFSGSSGAAYVGADGEAVLVTDGRYAERAQDEAPGWPVVLDRTWGWLLERHQSTTGLGVEADHLTWATVTELRDLDDSLQLIPTTDIIQTLRQVKDAAEIKDLSWACDITSAAFEDALTWLAPGLTERAVARRLVQTMIQMGAEAEAFQPIVASGTNGSRPHHDPGDRRLARGDLITMDFGARVNGYHADMTRTISLGVPSRELLDIHDLVRRSQAAGVDACVAGTTTKAVDGVCRAVIERAGHAEAFVHGTGHGVGLVIHETPFLGTSSVGTLRDHMTVTVEPGVYVPGLGGVRIEDVVLVSATGPRPLTTASRELITL